MADDLSLTPKMTFKEAAEAFIEIKRIQRTSPRTLKDYRQYQKILGEFFDPVPLQQLTLEHFRAYQRDRKAGATRINHELSFVTMLLKEAGCWEKLREKYKPLPVRKSTIGQALSDEDQKHLLEIAFTRKRWLVAACCATISAFTGVMENELLNLRRKDVDLKRRLLFVREGTKNDFRVAEVELNDSCLKAATKLVELFQERGGRNLNDYLIPHNSSGKKDEYDFTRHAYGFRRAWIEIRKAAGFPQLRYYDLRHTFLSRVAQNPDVSEATLQSLARHASIKMTRHYTHINKEARRAAVEKADLPIRALGNPVAAPAQPGAQPNAVATLVQALQILLKQAESVLPKPEPSGGGGC